MINFAYSAVYHVWREPGDPDQDVVEELTETTMVDHPHLGASDCGLEGMQYELEAGVGNQIEKLPTGVHVVWVTGTISFFDYDTDCGREYDSAIEIDKEVWRPAHNDEIRYAEEQSGADLSQYLKPTPDAGFV